MLHQQEQARQKDNEEEGLVQQSVEERDKELNRLVETALAEVLSARSELEETAQLAQTKQDKMEELEAQIEETERLYEEKRRVLEELRETESTMASLKDELEQEKGRCTTLQEQVEQQEKDLAASRAPKLTSDAETCTEASGVGMITTEGEADSSEKVKSEDGQGGVSAKNGGLHVPLPSVAEVWARLIPVSNKPKNGADTPNEAGDQGAHLFPGPCGTDVVIKPKGASSWQVVRPPLESAEDALERERMIVQRTLGIVEQLYQKRLKQQAAVTGNLDARTGVQIVSVKDASSRADKENGGSSNSLQTGECS